MVGAWTQQMFWRNSVEDPEEELRRIEKETHNIQEELDKHEETLNKVNIFLERCRLAQELRVRQQDPRRLKNRGNALMQEEKDRKKVNALPSLKEELLGRVDRWGDIIIKDRKLSELIGSECSFLEQIYETSLSTSSTRPPAKSSAAMSRTTGVPSSSRPLTRANSTLGLGSSGNLAKGGTPSSSSLRAPSSSKVYGSRNRTRMMGGGESPLRRPAVKTPSLRVQECSIIAPEASLLLSESRFTESVPLSSTIQDPSAADVDATSTSKAWVDRGRLELIADQVCTLHILLL